MRNRNRIASLLISAVMLATTTPLSAIPTATAETDMIYYICPNSKLLRQDEAEYSEMVKGGKLLFNAASNERESAQIIIADPGKYQNFTMSLDGDFKCSSNDKTISKDNFEMFFESYLKVEGYWTLGGSHKDGNGKVSYDFYPDALIPYNMAVKEGKNSFELNSSNLKNQGLWFTYTIPENTEAGLYTATLNCTYTLNGKKTTSAIDVEINVYDFELDTITQNQTKFAASTGHISASKKNRVNYLNGIIGIETENNDWDYAEELYQTKVNEVLNERKVTSGYNYGTFYNSAKLDEEINVLTEHIRSSDTKVPYFNLYSGYLEYSEVPECKARLNRYPTAEGRIGFEMIMKKLADKSIEDNFDYLQYAYIYIPQDDEPAEDSKYANIRTLVNSYIFEETKEEIKKYIESKKSPLQNKLINSVDGILYIHTVGPTENSGNWGDILYQGLQAKGISEWKESYEYYDSETKENKTYTINVPGDFCLKCFCPQFNDFSDTDSVKCTKSSDLYNKLEEYQNKGTNFWWYSTLCTGRSISTAGYMINENHDETTSLNSLAIARANKWQQYNLGILGELYWGVDVFRYIYNPDRHKKFSIPLEDTISYPYNIEDTEYVKGNIYFKPDIGITATNGDDYTSSDGMLIYPTKQLLKNLYGITDEKTLNTKTAEYGCFCSSIRLENIGEAADDYDYLCLAEQYVKDNPEYKVLLDKIIFSIIEPGNVDYTDTDLTNSENLAAAREALAHLISGEYDSLLKLNTKLINMNHIIGNSADKFVNQFTEIRDSLLSDTKMSATEIDDAYDKLTAISHRLQETVRAKAVTFEVYPRGEGTVYVCWEGESRNNAELTDSVQLDFANCTCSVGSMNKISKNNDNGWREIIIPVEDLPVRDSIITDSAVLSRFYRDKNDPTTYISITRNTDLPVLDVVQPRTKDCYNNTRFWNYQFDESVKNWKTGTKGVSFEFKPINLMADANRSQNTLQVYFNQQSPWMGTTNLYKINLTYNSNGESTGGYFMIGDNKVEAVKVENGWYRFTIPFKLLEPRSSDAVSYSIDMIEFTWINHSVAIKNIKLFDDAGKGDLNYDGTIDEDDLIILNALLLGNGHVSLSDWTAADLNHDEVIDAFDMILLRQKVME